MFFSLSLSVDESRQSSIGNKTSYARLLILSSGYEFLGISSARAFNVSMALNGEYIYIYIEYRVNLRDRESFFLDFFSLFDNLWCF